MGLNYRDHTAETGMAAPAEPIVSSKSTNSLCGCADQSSCRAARRRATGRPSSAVVIARPAHELGSPEQAHAVIGGYVAANDVSERRLQMEGGGQWAREVLPHGLPARTLAEHARRDP